MLYTCILTVIVANSDAAEISKLAQDHVADLKGLLSKHSGLVPGVAYSQSIVGLSQLSYVENASGALLALNKDSSLGSTNGPNKGMGDERNATVSLLKKKEFE